MALVTNRKQSTRCLKLCLVTNLSKQNQHFDVYKRIILNAISGGVTSVQLREKTENLEKFRCLALKIKALLCPLKIPLIINDHVTIAKEVDAEGVHLGFSDLSPLEARKILGQEKIIGLSVYTQEQLYIATQLENVIDYIGVGAIFPSKTKSDCIPIGFSGLQKMTTSAIHPVIAIGGITEKNIGTVMKNGAYGVAVVSAIHDADNPAQAATDLLKNMNAFI